MWLAGPKGGPPADHLSANDENGPHEVARPNWEYIRVDVLLPDHYKLDGLSPLAKWTLIELWCHCGQHLTDGFVRDAKWKTFGTPRVRQQILAAGLAKKIPGGFLMHDFTGTDGHQRSRAEVMELKEKRRRSGRLGGLANAKQVLGQTLGQTLEQNSGKPLAEAEAEAKSPPNPPPSGGQRHAGQHENCRACGTNRRGPPPAPPPTPIPPPFEQVHYVHGKAAPSFDGAPIAARTRAAMRRQEKP